MLFLTFLNNFLKDFKGLVLRVDSRKTKRALYRYFLCFWRCLEFCSDPCACLGVTKVVPDILPVHWDTIGVFSAFKVEIRLVTAIL